jgi:pimeloyl-ACP methyl ester carboxylesterase
MEELLVNHKDLEFCLQTFGIKTDPAILLIAGAAGQAILWNQSFCEDLAKSGYFVIRFDNRDTGQSSGINYDKNPYNLDDMAEDAIAILDHFKIIKSHIVGLSMGGYIAQIMAINYPNRILSLSLIMTTINSASLRGIRGLSNLPGHNPSVVKQIANIYQKPRTTLEDRIKSLTDILQLFNGSASDFPYDEFYQLSKESYRRAKNNSAVRNHRLAILNSPADRTESLKELDIPILIIHGKADPIIPVQHAYYMKKNIPQAKLIIIEEMGHILSSIFTTPVKESLLEFFL